MKRRKSLSGETQSVIPSEARDLCYQSRSLASLGMTPRREREVMATRRKPNFLIVLIDDLRFDEFGACGHPYMKTPHIDRIAP